MPLRRPEPADFLPVAEILGQESPDDVDDARLWGEIEDARARSAVSRAYYAVFRTLKARLLPMRIEWHRQPSTFPRHGIHSALRDAVETEMRDHALGGELRKLIRRRNQCDYQFEPSETCRDLDDDLDAADRCLELIAGLTDQQLRAIASRLHDRENNRRRLQALARARGIAFE